MLFLLLARARTTHAQVAPNEAWRTIRTAHFRIHFPARLEPLGQRAAVRAEAAWAALSRDLVDAPKRAVDVVVADDQDVANGYATPLPTNRIVVYAHPPADEPALSFYDDWLDLVLTHELTHVFQLDYARGIYRLPRTLLGRNPIGFPQLTTPGWFIEGLATYEESHLTRAGRVRGTLHEMELRTAVLGDRFFSLDRASGTPVSWPGAYTRYAYGSLFLQWLSTRHGEEPVRRFIRIVGRRAIPYRLDAAARAAFGISYSRAWRDWEQALRARYAAQADSLRATGITEPEVLTTAGYSAGFPRFSPAGDTLAYVGYTGRDDPHTYRLTRGSPPREVAPRTSLAPAAWLPGGALLTTQIEARDPYRSYSDLYRISAEGDVRRLTDGARVEEVDVDRSGRRAVAVRTVGGTAALVRVDLPAGAVVRPLTTPSVDENWSLPRWSPDGTRIAASRWRTGGFYDVVVLDTSGVVLREITRDRAVDRGVAWSPDGRYVLFSSDRTGIPNLYAYDLAAGRLMQVTNVLTGAFEPDVSPDGRWIAFSYYQADGYHIARIPFDPARWRVAPPVRAEVRDPAPAPGPAASAVLPVRRYTPWPSLRPAGWTPLGDADATLGLGLGAAIAGADVVGRHAYAASVLTRARGGRTDWGAAYRFSGLVNPVLSAAASQQWDVAFGAGTLLGAGGDTIRSALLDREREASLAATFVRPRYRSYGWVSAGASLRAVERFWADPRAPGAAGVRLRDIPLDVGAVGSLGYSTVRGYAYSISSEEGFLAALSAQGRRYASPLPGDSTSAGYLRLVGQGRAFRPLALGGFARHVLAFRAAAGADLGARSPGLRVGGASGLSVGVPFAGALGFGESVTFPVRGYPAGAQVGDRAFSATGEYRYPIALIERGYRLAPLFLDRLWGSAFFDAGSAWCVRICDPARVGASAEPRPLLSVGAELGADLTLFYAAGLVLRAGVVAPLSSIEEASGSARPDPSLYVRIGRSF